jgi:hypothetical protein
VVVVCIGYYSLNSQAISRTNSRLNRLLNVKNLQKFEAYGGFFYYICTALDLGLANPWLQNKNIWG